MSNAGIGMAIHSLKIRVNEILLNRLSLNDLLVNFTENKDVKILELNLCEHENSFLYHYDTGSLFNIKLILDSNLCTSGYMIIGRDSKKEYVNYKI